MVLADGEILGRALGMLRMDWFIRWEMYVLMFDWGVMYVLILMRDLDVRVNVGEGGVDVKQ